MNSSIEVNEANALELVELSSELQIEQASALALKLRWAAEGDPHLKEVRSHLRKLIKAYEERNWNGDVDKAQLEESKKARLIVAKQQEFIAKRAETIKSALKKNDLNQVQLAMYLGISKNYLSAKMNGVREFTLDDLRLINRLLYINFNELIDRTLEEEVKIRIKTVSTKIEKPGVKLKAEDLDFEFA